MSDVVVFDTNALPISGGLDGPLWLTIRKLCSTKGIRVALPDLVVAESANLRHEKYRESAEAALQALRGLGKFYDLGAVYVPSAEEVCTQWEGDLRDAFDIVDTHGDDAARALHREARRIRPARGGKGGRDSAIWLTVLRLAASNDRVWFVSRNTTDFSGGDPAALHPHLADEVRGVVGDVEYITSVYAFIAAVSEAVALPKFEAPAIADELRFELRDRLHELATADAGGSDIADEIDAEGLVISEVRTLRAHGIDGEGLALCDGRGSIAVGPISDGLSLTFTFKCWVGFDPASTDVQSAELHSAEFESQKPPL